MSAFLPYTPRYPLSGFVECLWYVCGARPLRRERILPTGTVELIVNFGSPYHILDKSSLLEKGTAKRSWVSGFHSEYLVTESTGSEAHVMGARFRPGGATAFFGLPMSELRNQVIELELLVGQPIHELREKLLAADGPAGRFAILENALIASTKPDAKGFDTVFHAVREIKRPGSRLSIRTLSDDIGISQRRLIDLFHRHVGVSPKVYARVCRFQSVLNAIDPRGEVSWVEVALSCGYYDQAHFNHDFTAFSGVSPSNYLRQRREGFGDTLEKGQYVHFVPGG